MKPTCRQLLSSLSLIALVLGVTTAAGAGIPAPTPALNDSEKPGSVLVFYKFVKGTTVTPDQGTLAKSQFEISVTCPNGSTCADYGQAIKLKARWVCPGHVTGNACPQQHFDLATTVNGTILFNPDNRAPKTATVAAPPCERGYLIVWVVNSYGAPIKFDGLIGDAVLRGSETSARAYNALPIQAATLLATLDPTDADADGNLDFDGTEYQAITEKFFGSVRFESSAGPTPAVETSLTLLTLDVVDGSNTAVVVQIDFYNEHEELKNGTMSFVCWGERRLTAINHDATTAAFGTKGLVENYIPPDPEPAPVVTVVGLVETTERFTQTIPVPCHLPICIPYPPPVKVPGMREYAYPLFNDGVPVTTTFEPN